MESLIVYVYALETSQEREREDKQHDVAETVITLGLGLIQSR